MRAVKGTSLAVPSPTFVGADGETSTACTGTPTCTVTRADGTALTAAVVAQVEGGDYTAAITTTHTSRLDTLDLVWTGTAAGVTQVYRQQIEVVSAHWVQIAELRNSPQLTDPARFPTAVLVEQRDALADLAEEWCQRAFVRRARRIQVQGNGSSALLLDRWPARQLLSVTVDGVSRSVADFDLDLDGTLVWRGGTFPAPSDGARNVTVEWEHGEDAPPGDLRMEALRYLVWKIQSAQITRQAQAISETVDGRTVRYSTPDPDRGRPTGAIDLDATLVRLSHRLPGVA